MNQATSGLPLMERAPSFSQYSASKEGSSHHDELFMQQSLLFSQSLKDLKNLREQLYSAAEYFERSYKTNEHKILVVDNLKDYSVKALINTVDHLGSMAYKVESLLDERIGKIPGVDLRLSCLDQRIRTCQTFIDYQGVSQQSFLIKTPHHHKRYTIPDAELIPAHTRTTQEPQSFGFYAGDDLLQFGNGTSCNDFGAKFGQAMTRKTPPPSLRKTQSSSPLLQSYASPVPFSFSRMSSTKELGTEKQTVSPLHFPLMRAESALSKSPNPLSYDAKRKQYHPNPRRSVSVVARGEKEKTTKEMVPYPSRSKRLFRALVSIRKPKSDS